ncbi:hypothetical protein DPM19_28845 [Actinomadura craniellae]|uniref:Peptidase M4 domain-containing protein n=2 Tax=Actinomadura craniellae TaxID=2231787 RepID=A0A365GXS2_9ACTN|nr:hypothetical protein DPM19_28845 [Actinomadura craniellae]
MPVAVRTEPPIGTVVPEEVAQRVTQSFRGGPTTTPAAGPRPSPVPTPLPMAAGHRLLIYKQDPSVAELGIRTVFVQSTILNGPADTRIRTELPGVTPVGRNIDGDFIFPPNSPQFDCAHTFAVVRETLSMYERHNGGRPLPFAWNSGSNTDPITVFPRAGIDANAFYSRTAKALKFFSFTPPGASRPVMTNNSFDVVTHEMAHAILDGIKPGWIGTVDNPPQTGGLHEAFGDLTAIFMTLSQADQAEAFVAATKADLHATSFLPAMGEEFGAAFGLPFGLRNADNDLRLSDVGNEVHDISQVFTGGVYDILADVFAFELSRQRQVKSPTQILMEVASSLCKLLFDAIVASPRTGATYADVVGQLVRKSAERDDPPIYRTCILNRFAVREVVEPPVSLDELMSGNMDMANPHYTGGGDAKRIPEVRPADEKSASLRAVQDRSGCCGTMQMPEFRVVPADRLATRGPLTDEDILAAELAELRESFGKLDQNR